VTSYDTIIVGAGPAGSTAARLLAQRGARVLLLDKARFPRDKPCGGGVTLQAANEAGLDLSPVIERTVNEVRVSFRQRAAFARTSSQALTYMTQRCRLDAYLAERAAVAGAAFHDGSAAREIEASAPGVIVRANGDTFSARTLIGADGANGIVAKALGLEPAGELAVALEGNVSSTNGLTERWKNAIALDFGGTPGGYGWLFPKGDHVNVGVGGWKWIGPTLRERVDRLSRALAIDPSKLVDLRGHHLPMRRPGAPIVSGPVLLAGDAAGLVDPLSGEGISAAFTSGRLAAEAVGRMLDGSASNLSSYELAVEREIMADIAVSRKLQAIFQRLPGPCVAVMRRSDRFWGVLIALVRGEMSYRGVRTKLGLARYGLDAAAWTVSRFESDKTRRLPR
jgi:geranylgeranyl reductase family protein